MMHQAISTLPPLVRRMVLRQPRQAIEATIEQLIAYLDALDGDTDLEPEPDEDGHDAEIETRTEGLIAIFDNDSREYVSAIGGGDTH